MRQSLCSTAGVRRARTHTITTLAAVEASLNFLRRQSIRKTRESNHNLSIFGLLSAAAAAAACMQTEYALKKRKKEDKIVSDHVLALAVGSSCGLNDDDVAGMATIYSICSFQHRTNRWRLTTDSKKQKVRDKKLITKKKCKEKERYAVVKRQKMR